MKPRLSGTFARGVHRTGPFAGLLPGGMTFYTGELSILYILPLRFLLQGERRFPYTR